MSKKKTPTKTETFNKEKAEQTVKSATSLTVDTAVKKLTEVGLAVGKTLNDISQQVAQNVNEFQTVSQAVELKKQELEQLFEKESVLRELEELQTLTTEENNRFEERKAALNQEFERNREEREYTFQQQTRQQQDELAEQIRVKKLEERNRQDELDRSWKKREEELSSKETEFISLKAQVASFPEKLDSEKKEAAGAAAGAVKREYEHKLALLEKDRSTENAINLSKISQLTETNNKLAAQLLAAEARIAESEKNVKSIAEKALESSGSQKTLSELQMMQNSPNGSTRSKQA